MKPWSRRNLLFASSAMLVGAACQKAPAFFKRQARRVSSTWAGMPTTDGAGVKLLRLIGQPSLRHLDPFLMLDRFHSDDAQAYIRGFPDHPHRGFETVTVMRQGRMRHEDSKGNRGVVEGGGSQWMTAGRGIVHSEMPEQQAGLLSGFQLWLNLPAKEKWVPYRYQDLAPSQLAQGRLAGHSMVSVISGDVDGLVGPVPARPTEPVLLRLFLEDERPVELRLPRAHTAFLFVTEGAASIGQEASASEVTEGLLAVLDEGNLLRVQARGQRTELLIAAARPLREPIVQRGPFVMNTEAEIQQAFLDYRSGRLGRE